MKKIISLFCTASILSGMLCTSASASHIPLKSDIVNSASYTIGGEEITVDQYIYQNEIIYTKATNGTDIAELVDNTVYFNGKKLSTISISTDYETAAQRRAGWINQENCLYGTIPGNYTKFISSRNVNVPLENTITTIGIPGVTLVLSLFLPLPTVASTVASTIVALAIGSKYSNAKTFYFREEIYGHKDFPNLWQQVNCTFYFDKNHTDYATSSTYYRAWA